jgi:hypothetical protein
MRLEAQAGRREVANSRYLRLAKELIRGDLEPKPKITELRSQLMGARSAHRLSSVSGMPQAARSSTSAIADSAVRRRPATRSLPPAVTAVANHRSSVIRHTQPRSWPSASRPCHLFGFCGRQVKLTQQLPAQDSSTAAMALSAESNE